MIYQGKAACSNKDTTMKTIKPVKPVSDGLFADDLNETVQNEDTPINNPLAFLGGMHLTISALATYAQDFESWDKLEFRHRFYAFLLLTANECREVAEAMNLCKAREQSDASRDGDEQVQSDSADGDSR